jgi:phage gp36-like protein
MAIVTNPAEPQQGNYCNATTDLDDIFHQSNVNKWALLSNVDPASQAGQLEIATRRQKAVEYATAFINDRLREGAYAIPIQTSDGYVPLLLVQLCATYAGVWLYENRGTVDYNAETGQPEHRYSYKAKWVEKILDQLQGQKIRLDAVRSGTGKGTNAPFVSRTPRRHRYGDPSVDDTLPRGPILP